MNDPENIPHVDGPPPPRGEFGEPPPHHQGPPHNNRVPFNRNQDGYNNYSRGHNQSNEADQGTYYIQK